MKSLLTTSAQRCYRSCPRKYEISYVKGYRSTSTSEALSFGTLVHKGLEAWWRAGPSPRYETVQYALDSSVADPWQRVRAKALIVGYAERWGSMVYDGQLITVVDVEREFVSPLRNPETGAQSRKFKLAGKFDVLVDIGGKRYVVEHKTSSADLSPGSDYWQRLAIDSQCANYLAGAGDVAGVIYDVLRTPSQRPLKATPEESRKYAAKTGELYANQRSQDETLEEYYVRLLKAIANEPNAWFARALIVRTDDEADEAEADIWHTATQINASTANRNWPRNPDACFSYGSRCPFFGVCSKTESLDDPTRFRKKESQHEELTIGRGDQNAAI